jgi:transcription initiation factor TFIIIB Brf1 subunit/transcription initiation factor TFIIB
MCEHDQIFQLHDVHTGDVVCSNCGVILGIEYLHHNTSTSAAQQTNRVGGDVENIIHQLHLPDSFVELVINDYNKKYNTNTTQPTNIRKISSCIYNTVNSVSNCLSINDISKVTGLPPASIDTSRNATFHDLNVLADKYLNLFDDIPFRDKTLIKGKLMLEYETTGYNPLTIIAGVIYLYCKHRGLRRPMCQIASTIGISPISIRRFINSNDSISFGS